MLKELAKTRGIKGISKMKKEELVEAMLTQDTIDEKKSSPKEINESKQTNEPRRAKQLSLDLENKFKAKSGS